MRCRTIFTMNDESIRNEIKAALAAGPGGDFTQQGCNLLTALGYRSERAPDGQTGAVDEFIASFPAKTADTQSERNFRGGAQSMRILFQVTDTEIAEAAPGTLFAAAAFDSGNAKSFIFVAVELNGESYSRSEYAAFAREINKRLPMPIAVLFRAAAGRLTLAFVHRRVNRRNPERDVLGSVSLLREIDPATPHRAHIDALAELSLTKRLQWMESRGKPLNFDGLLDAWLDTLDTKELNRKFYRDLFAWFKRAVNEATFPARVPPEEHVIRLVTRLLFVWFIKEKRLIAEELFVENRIRRLLNGYDRDTGDSYYRAVLQNLFFATLNTEIDRRRFSKANNAGHRDFSRYRYKDEIGDPDRLLELFARTPFINGGLFDCLDSYEATGKGGYRIDCFTDNRSRRKLLSIPNRLFFDDSADKPGLITLFNRYKFTVEENTPVSQEVALDPELLGNVFENLLAAYNPETRETARKQTGSYYTPRPVVDYMADEALTAALARRCKPTDSDDEFWRERLRYLLDYNDAGELFDPDETEAVVRAVAKLRVLDPAVGSGAFPMSVLRKLTLALRRLDPDNELWKELQREQARRRADEAFGADDQAERERQLAAISGNFERYRDSDFGRKLYLIQNSIYGVDIQPIACQIAKLRFFITLAIEQESDPAAPNFGIKPLPNLETRFVAANTLLGLDKPVQSTLGQADAVIKQLERQLKENRERHFHVNDRHKKLERRKKDRELRAALAAELRTSGLPAGAAEKVAHWNPYDQNSKADWFDAEYMFGVTHGFDAVIGNPPYVKVEHLNDATRKQLRRKFAWPGDLYEHFISRGLQLTSENGVFSYIANDSYVALSSKQRIRELMLENQLLHLVRAPSQTFDASIYAAIFVLAKRRPAASHAYMSGELNAAQNFEHRKLGKIEYATVHGLPNKKFLLSGESNLLKRLLSLGKIKDYCRVLDTGIHSGNVRSKIFFAEDNGCRERLLQGKQIQRFSLQWETPKARYKFCDINYQPLPIPGIGRGGRPSRKNEYWQFCGDMANHRQPERILMRQTDDDLVAAYHSEQESGRFYTDNTLFTVLPNSRGVELKYFLALFNSRLLNFVYHSISQERGKSQAQVKIKNVNELPAVVPEDNKQTPVIRLADRILQAKAADPAADTAEWEAEIDRLIYALYGLTEEEVAEVEGRPS